MSDARLKDPHSDFVAVVGSPIEAANLRAQGYTDVTDEDTSGPQAKLDGTSDPSGNGGTESSTDEHGDGQGEQQGTAAGPKPPAPRGLRPAKP